MAKFDIYRTSKREYNRGIAGLKEGAHWMRYFAFLIISILIISQTGCDRLINPFLKPAKASTIPSGELLHKTKKNKKIEKKIQNYLQSNHLSGSVLVAKNKEILFNGGIGLSNRQKGKKNTSSTTYPIASITKAFVATSILLLQEKGKLKITDSVSKYIPNFPNGRKMKLYHLLTHSSGIQSPILQPGEKKPQDLINEIEKRKVSFQPGQKWDYNDANYMVLGYIIEKVSKSSLHQYIQKNIFNKVQMKSSGFMTIKHPDPYTSLGYIQSRKGLKSSKPFTMPLLFGCGDIYTTPYDLGLFDQALLTGKLVNKKSLKEMLKPGPHSIYGLGLYHHGNIVFSRGVLGGWESFHAMYKDQTSVVIMLNTRSKYTDIQKYSNDLHKIVETKKRVSK